MNEQSPQNNVAARAGAQHVHAASNAPVPFGPVASRQTALRWAFTAALLGFVIAFVSMSRADRPGDFLYWYTAAQALLRGESPYDVIPAIDPARFETNFFYPLPAAVLTVPFVALPYAIAGGLFVAISSGLLAYGLARQGVYKLLIFASAPYLISAVIGTWTPVIAAAVVLPWLGFLAVVKPNVGLASFLYRPTRWMVVGSVLLLAISLVIRPGWPAEWFHDLMEVPGRVVPLLTPSGPLLLLLVTRWRRPEARLLLGYACVPQAPWFYDQLILWLIPATARQSINYVYISLFALLLWMYLGGVEWRYGTWFLSAVLYLPPLVMIMRRPNEGEPDRGWRDS